MTANKVRRVDAEKSESTSITTKASDSVKKNAFDSFLIVGLSAFLVASLFSAPEGDIREGDYLPIANIFLLFLTGVAFCLYRFRRNSGDVANRQESPRSKSTIWIDRFLGIFLFFATLSYLRVVIFHCGDVRLATNAYWTFVIPPLFYFLLRFCRTYVSRNALVGLLLVALSGAVAQSAYSVYSYAVVNPRLREAYRNDPEKWLRENGITFGQDSERLLFEKRLLDSSEPTGTYGLANTLAGALAPAFVLMLLITPWKKLYWRSKNDAKFKFSTLALSLVWTFALLLIFFVLILSKSRSGVLAVVGGVGFYLLLSIRQFAQKDKKRTVRVILGAVAALFLFIGAVACAFAVGLVDREVFTEAGKSLGYRLDYWRATAAMIRDYPLFGIGPGEFQTLYARYILPTASEFIADPHNFAFELAALFGIPAVIFYALFVFNLVYQALVGKKEPSTSQDASASPTFVLPKSIWFGALLGLLILLFCVAFQSAPVDVKFLFFAAASFGVLFFVARRLFADVDVETVFTNGVLIATLATFLINLCAAGGTGYPAIIVPFFLIAAFLTNRLDVDAAANESYKSQGMLQKLPSGAILASTALLGVFTLTAFQPGCRAMLFELRYTPENASTSPYIDALDSGATERVDRWSTPIALQFYYYATRQYLENPGEQNKERWQKTREHLRRTSPNAAPWRENCADLNWSFYRRAKSRTEFRDDALTFYRESVERSPTDCTKRAKLALVEFDSGDVEQAKINAKEALDQDERTPHEDRKLEDDLRQKLRDALK